MSIDSLPDEILDLMFERILFIEDVINCSKVCRHWWTLAQRRLNHVHYLIACLSKENCLYQGRKFIFYRPDKYSYHYMNILPNLKIIDVDKSLDRAEEGIFLRALESRQKIKGVAYPYYEPEGPCKSMFLKNIEMLAPGYLTISNGFVISLCSDTIRQLFLEDNYNNLDDIISKCKSLQRIHIHHYEGARLLTYKGLPTESLQVLELDISYFYGPDTCINNFIDNCPKLNSLFLRFNDTEFNFIPSKNHKSLENLVLEYYSRSKDPRPIKWTNIPQFLQKVPNLKHLAIRSCPGFKDIHIYDILTSCPNLKLIDLRDCPDINSDSETLVNEIIQSKDYQIEILTGSYSKLPLHHHEKVVCQGFDFMKHIFHKSWKNIPLFLTYD
ncbi:uncharacterized protein LOC128393015 [Panonychus citri]|uniref:uncharacterized protein LOC128393015 n=1 Tax=Panonychus citri TaxID=50023 RepID=UPI002307E685|nr:uncharacterized protein LOC128393015 [Panonychus citri]XP_053209092.1 uncharacterized protein LOC128393015 [Panonychus citri]